MAPNPYLEALDSLGEDDDDLIFAGDDMFDQDDMFGDDEFEMAEDDFGGLANARVHAMARQAAALTARARAAARGRKVPLRNLPSAPGNYRRTARIARENALAARAAAAHRVSPNYRSLLEKARGDDVIFGIDSGSAGINGGVTAALSASPQKRNLPVKIALTQNIANSFVCSDIRVGVEPILATTSNISLAIFVQDSTAPKFRAVVNEVGMDFTIEVTNITGANARFTCTVTGVYVAPWVRPW